MTEGPRNLRYADADGEKYRKLTQDSLSPFHGTDFKDVFVYAVAYGYQNGLRNTEIERPQPNIPLSAMRDEDLWLLKAVAIAEVGSLDILRNPKEAYKLTEEYANGAIGTLYLEVFGGKPGEPYKRMMRDVLEEFERLDLEET